MSSHRPGHPPGTGGGFFAHHGVWAPGVRLFRRRPFSTKALIMSLAFTLPLLGVPGLAQRRQARLDARGSTSRSRTAIVAWAQETSGALTREQAQQMALRAGQIALRQE